MSPTMPPLRCAVAAAVAAASPACTRRGLATTSGRRSAGNILDILGSASSRAPSHAAAQPAVSRDPTLASRMGARAFEGVTERSHALFAASRERQSFQKHMYRKWNTGDVYAPHDLSGAEQKKWKTSRKTPSSDAFDTLGINPVAEYKNFTIMSEYMTEMGRIKHSQETGLRPKNQRKIAKAIRRAIGLGLMPSVHRHPLVLKTNPPSRFG